MWEVDEGLQAEICTVTGFTGNRMQTVICRVTHNLQTAEYIL